MALGNATEAEKSQTSVSPYWMTRHTQLCDCSRIRDKSGLGHSHTLRHEATRGRRHCHLSISTSGCLIGQLMLRLTPPSAAASGSNAAPAVAATAPMAMDRMAIVAADFRTEYRDVFVPSSRATYERCHLGTLSSYHMRTSRVNHTLPGCVQRYQQCSMSSTTDCSHGI